MARYSLPNRKCVWSSKRISKETERLLIDAYEIGRAQGASEVRDPIIEALDITDMIANALEANFDA